MKQSKIYLLLLVMFLTCACDDGFEFDGGGGGGSAPAQSTSGGNACEGFSLFANLGACISLGWASAFAAGAGLSSEATTTEQDFALSGTAFVSPEDSSCCPADSGVTVTWSNDTTGEYGTAASSVSARGGGHTQDWDHQWQARIPLRTGLNRITVVAADRSGNWAMKSVTVNREPSRDR